MAVRAIYIVRGATGEYDSRHEWLVMAYTSHHMATAHCNAANDWARAHGVYGTETAHMPRPTPQALRDLEENPYDPAMILDYTGVSYDVIESLLNDTYEDAEAGRNDSP